MVGHNGKRAKDVVAEIEDGGGTATFWLTTLVDPASAQDQAEARRDGPVWPTCANCHTCARQAHRPKRRTNRAYH
jgi:hypothetical protein